MDLCPVTMEMFDIQSVPLATEPGISLIIPKYGAPGSILSGRKWWPLPAHVMMSSHFLHSEVKSASNFVAISSLVINY